MKKLIVAALTVFVIVGCGSSNTATNTDTNTTVSLAPVDGGSGAYQTNISGGGGYINVEYVIKDQTAIDYLSFFITHSINGNAYEHYFPSVFSNGSLIRVESKIYIPANGSQSPNKHKIIVEYYDNDGRRIIDTFTYIQKPAPAASTQTITTTTVI
jgi:hypothetical protein